MRLRTLPFFLLALSPLKFGAQLVRVVLILQYIHNIVCLIAQSGPQVMSCTRMH